MSTVKTTDITITDAGSGSFSPILPPISATPRIRIGGQTALVEWEGPGALWWSDRVVGPWARLADVQSPYPAALDSGARFYELRNPRSTRVYVPAAYDGRRPLPLVMVLTGYSEDSAWMESYLPLFPMAESRGFLLCYPDGTLDARGYPFWNATDACCNFYDSKEDDSAYLRSVIEEIMRNFAIDRKRIHVIGASNGGFMSHRWP